MPKTQTVKYTATGRPYLTYYSTRIYLDEVMRLDAPVIINGTKYNGVQGISNTCSFLIHLSGDGETAKVLMQY